MSELERETVEHHGDGIVSSVENLHELVCYCFGFIHDDSVRLRN